MAQTIKSTQGNIQQSLKAGDLEAAQEAAEQKAEALAAEGINPFDTTVPVDDYRFVVAVDGQKVEKDVWVSTGCPVPSTSNEDFGDAMDANTMFPIYNEEGESTPVRLLEHCYGEDYTLSNNYYVYPTAVVYDGTAEKSDLVASDCEPNQLYDSYNGTPLNPLDHPCYWGKLEPGESVRIPLNKFGWSLSGISNLKLRLRTPCESGAEWCSDEGRIKYGGTDGTYSLIASDPNYNQLSNRRVDDSDLLAIWSLEVDDGSGNYGSSNGHEDDFIDLNCNVNDATCRSVVSHTQITMYRMSEGRFLFGNQPYLNLVQLGESLSIIDFSTNESPIFSLSQNINTIFDYFVSKFNQNSNLIFQFDNLTRKDNRGQILEYQLISNQKFPQK